MSSSNPAKPLISEDPHTELERLVREQGKRPYTFTTLEQLWADLGYTPEQIEEIANEPVGMDFNEWLRQRRASQRSPLR